MGVNRRVWRRHAARRAKQERAQANRLARVRRRFRAQTQPTPSWFNLVAGGAIIFAATVAIGTAVVLTGPRWAPTTLRASDQVTSERRLVGPIRVIDGDTIEAEGERFRIANIDAPEKPPRSRCPTEAILAGRATAHLQALISDGYEVTFQPNVGQERDTYGRLLGRIAVDGLDVGRAQLDAGLAAPWRGRKPEWC